MSSASEEQRRCSECGKEVPRGGYSKNQWKKGQIASKCKICVDAQSREEPKHALRRDKNGSPAAGAITSTPLLTEISLNPRPQKRIEGFEDLSYCTDWPKTKNGKHPGAQSAVYTPLLACALGPIEGYCTEEQLAVAMEWWTAALPAWPRWVKELQTAGVNEPSYREMLLQSAKGQPNPLIHKAKGRGT